MSEDPILTAPAGSTIVALTPDDAALLAQARSQKAEADARAAEAAQRAQAQAAAEAAAMAEAEQHLRHLEQLDAENPFASAAYYFQHQRYIDTARANRRGAKR